jgi:hypothetical protein
MANKKRALILSEPRVHGMAPRSGALRSRFRYPCGRRGCPRLYPFLTNSGIYTARLWLSCRGDATLVPVRFSLYFHPLLFRRTASSTALTPPLTAFSFATSARRTGPVPNRLRSIPFSLYHFPLRIEKQGEGVGVSARFKMHQPQPGALQATAHESRGTEHRSRCL